VIVNAEFVGHASAPYNKFGRHLDLIKAITSVYRLGVYVARSNT